MKRTRKVEQCKQLINEERPNHLHIRREAMVSDFTSDFLSEMDKGNVIDVTISEWEYSEMMETLRWQLQRELSATRYWLSRTKSYSLQLFGMGIGRGGEKELDYSRATNYLHKVAKSSNNQKIIHINYRGDRPIDDFSWISKLNIPESATVVTDGFQKCELDGCTEFEIGRLSEEETVDYLGDLRESINESEASEIHHIHHGNPVAIDIAIERGELRRELSGESLRELWSRVYDDKLTAAERDLLIDSFHLIDLDAKDVAIVSNKSRGEAQVILRGLESKGVVSQKQAGLFTTDKYVSTLLRSTLLISECSSDSVFERVSSRFSV